MTFLDTVDGKLARITLKSSKLGNVFDHGIDLVHPPFWYWAWAAGLQNGPHALSEPTLLLMLAVIVAGYVLQRGIEGIALWRLGLEIQVLSGSATGRASECQYVIISVVAVNLKHKQIHVQ